MIKEINNIMNLFLLIVFEYYTNILWKFIYFFYNLINNYNIQLISKIWISFELINWMIYLFMYMKIINPNSLYFNKSDINKVIGKFDKLDKYELEHIIKGSIVYDKINHTKIDYDNFSIKTLSKKEMFFLLGYTLFGIEKNKIFQSEEIKQIYNLLLKIENKLEHKFNTVNTDRYLYKSWGREFINFHFRPLILQLPIRILMNIFHDFMVFKLKFKYKVCNKSKISYLYKERDLNKKDIIFIHGFGLGYIPYIRKLLELNEKFNLIIMILPNISSYTYYDDLNCGYFPTHDLIRNSFYDFINFRKISQINILAHSFGTYITQIIRNDDRYNLINKIIMIDPIIFWIGCFKMSLYIDKIASRGTSIMYWILEVLTNYFIFKCLYLRYVCYRVMFGPDFLIYNSSDLENKNILLVLEHEDKVIPSELLYNKIKNKQISYYYLNNAEHGSVLLNSSFNTIFTTIISYF